MDNVPQEQKQGTVSKLLGPLATSAFWVDVLKSIIQEAAAAFFMALGGTLLFYGKNKRNKDVANTYENPSTATSATANKAFGGGYSPAPTYQPAQTYPVAPVPSGDTRFPGFGPRL